MPYRAPRSGNQPAEFFSLLSILKECGITPERIRKAKSRAKESGRGTELWCGAQPLVWVQPDGKLKLAGRGSLSGARRSRKKRRRR